MTIKNQKSKIKNYPFDSHFLDLGGLQYHFLDEGNGEPVVMLHGNPTWSFYFRNLVTALRDTCRCVVPDHIGCGISDKPGDDRYEYTLRRRAEDVASLLENLQITKNITLVLHDWGGMIGMVFAHWHPERIKRLVILNTAAFHMPKNKPLPWQISLCRNRLFGEFLVRGMNLFCRGAARQCSVRRLSPDVKQAYLSPYNNWANRIAVHRFVEDIPLKPEDRSFDLVTEVEKGLNRFRETPMMICWGGRDFVFDDEFLSVWKEHFPDAEVHRFADAGHYVLEDKPDEICQLVSRFVATD